MARLAAAGVREVFGVAGGALTPLLGALDEQEVISYVGVRHESAAAMMAAATAQATGRVAVCLGEQGPGTLNLVAGLGGAHNNNLPVLALTVSGNSRTARAGSGALMELNATLASRAVTKWRRNVDRADQVPDIVDIALRKAVLGRPGPVHIDIPRDVLADVLSPEFPGLRLASEPTGPAVDSVSVRWAAELLSGAQRPVVIAGGGAARSGVAAVLRQVADHLAAVTLSTQMGIGVLGTGGGLFAGHGGVIGGPALIRAVEEADVLLAVGCRFSSWWWRDGRSLVSDSATVVRLDSDRTLPPGAPARMLTLHGDADVSLPALWAELARSAARAPSVWAVGIRGEYIRYTAELDELGRQLDPPAHPAALACAVARMLRPEDLVVLDGGHTSFWSNDFVPALDPRRVFHEPGMAQLGFGVPYANALALAFPDRRVVTITGDGAFGFHVAELDTARRLGLRTITVIADNASWGVIGAAQERAGFSLGTDLSGTDYAGIARGFGCLGIRVDDLADLSAAYSLACESPAPVVLDCRVRFEPHPMLPAFGRTTSSVST